MSAIFVHTDRCYAATDNISAEMVRRAVPVKLLVTVAYSRPRMQAENVFVVYSCRAFYVSNVYFFAWTFSTSMKSMDVRRTDGRTGEADCWGWGGIPCTLRSAWVICRPNYKRCDVSRPHTTFPPRYSPIHSTQWNATCWKYPSDLINMPARGHK